MNRKNLSSLTISLAMLFSIIVIGSVGYITIEDYSLLDAIFMTVITVSTVGFSEVKPLSEMGELFTIFMIIFSFGAFAYAVTSITRFIVDGTFQNYFINKRTARKIRNLEGHVIICGFGRNGSEAAQALYNKGEKFVVIDDNSEVVNEMRKRRRWLYVEGDSTDDDVLFLAGIEKAKALISTLPSDADNLLVVLSARTINQKLHIISRASYEWSDMKLRKAGANNVLMPDIVGGRQMAKLVAQPDIIRFLSHMMRKPHGEAHLVELRCEEFSSAFQEKTIGELKFKRISGVNIVGLKIAGGQYLFNPNPEHKLSAEYSLFVMGTTEQLNKLRAAVLE